MTDPNVRLVDSALGPVETRIEGDGPAVLIVHGTPGSWRQTFSLAEDVRDAYTAVSPSRPGYGRTPLQVGRTPEEQARAYAAVLDALGIGSAFVIGASGGTPSSLAFARLFPARTDGLVIACGMAIELIAVPALLRLASLPLLGEAYSPLSRALSRRALGSEKAIRRRMSKDLTPDELSRAQADPRIREDLIRFARTHLHAPAGLAGLRNDIDQVRRVQRGNGWTFDGIAAPTLVLHGSADVTTPLAHAEHHARAVPGATLEVYDGAGHLFIITRRRELDGRIRRFLDEVGAAKGRR